MCILRQSLIACAAANVVDTKIKQTRKLTSSGHKFFVSCIKLVRKKPSIKLFASQARKKKNSHRLAGGLPEFCTPKIHEIARQQL